MDFDEREKKLNCLINEVKNIRAQIKWNDEEIKLNEESLISIRENIARLFFAQIALYLQIREYDIIDIELEREYRENNVN